MNGSRPAAPKPAPRAHPSITPRQRPLPPPAGGATSDPSSQSDFATGCRRESIALLILWILFRQGAASPCHQGPATRASRQTATGKSSQSQNAAIPRHRCRPVTPSRWHPSLLMHPEETWPQAEWAGDSAVERKIFQGRPRADGLLLVRVIHDHVGARPHGQASFARTIRRAVEIGERPRHAASATIGGS